MENNNWLSVIDGKKKLSQINFFGTHDTMTAFVSLTKMARCQNKTLSQQLQFGVRLLDIRLSRKGDEFYLVHSLADCYTDEGKSRRIVFSDVIKECKDFLRENPRETIIMSVKQDRGIQNRFFFPALYKKYIAGDSESWYLENEIPCLEQCRGKIVLMRRCKVFRSFDKSSGGLDFSVWKDQKRNKPKPLPLKINKNQSAMIQDRYCLAPKAKWEKCAKPFLDSFRADGNTVGLHYLSTSFREKETGLEKTAEKVNSQFMEYDLAESSGWFFFDFPDVKLKDKVIASNKGEF